MTAKAAEHRLYLYTIPKSGTYMVAELLEVLGFHNTGFHISKNFYLDTKAYDLEFNATTPSKTKRNGNFEDVLRRLTSREFAFGHLCPMEFPDEMRPGFDYVYGYRHPRQCLVSEFIDFRYRRHDAPNLSSDRVADDGRAFEIYLEKHGPDHRLQWGRFLAFHRALGRHFLPSGKQVRAVLYNFDTLRDPVRGPAEIMRLAEFLAAPMERQEAVRIHERLIRTRTKTRREPSTSPVSPQDLWTKAAEEFYAKLVFEDVETEVKLFLDQEAVGTVG